MIGPVLVVVLLVRAWTGHGHEIACEPQTCLPQQQLARAKDLPPVPVDMGSHYDKRTQLAVKQP